MSEQWVSQQLHPDHESSYFDSGQPALDEWLWREALRSQQQDVARTHVWTAPDDPRVVAYYSIAPTQIAADIVSRGVAGGHSLIPSFLLGRLAVDRAWQGRGYGGQLLRDALETCVAAARISAGRVIVVNPIDAAAREFYRRYNFVDTKGPEGRMTMKVVTARKALGL